MIVFTDIFSGDELLSDSYPKVEVEDVVYEVTCKKITKGAIQVDIGANASAEGEDAEEQVDDQSYQVIDVVDSFRLEQTSFDKKSYLTYIKGYMKEVKARLAESNPERIPIFEKGAQAYVKKVLEHFSDFDFYTGSEMNPEGMVMLLGYREDGMTPYLVYWKDGLRAEKF